MAGRKKNENLNLGSTIIPPAQMEKSVSLTAMKIGLMLVKGEKKEGKAQTGKRPRSSEGGNKLDSGIVGR